MYWTDEAPMRFGDAIRGSRGAIAGTPHRVGLVSNYEMDPVVTYLKAIGSADRVAYNVDGSGFAGLEDTLTRPCPADWNSAAILITGADAFPELSYRSRAAWSQSGLEELTAQADQRIDMLVKLLADAARAWAIPVLWIPYVAAGPPLSGASPGLASEAGLLPLRLALGVCAAAADIPNVTAMAPVAPVDGPRQRDEAAQLLLDAGLPFGLDDCYRLAHAVHAHSTPATARKVIVTDLDDTAWAGTLGEDGPAGISARPETGTYHFAAYQRFLALLASQGVVLAIASRNSPSDVDDVLRDPALRADAGIELEAGMFAVLSCSQDSKVIQVKRICERLNILPESVVFIDDDPAERFGVESGLPGVLCLAAPRAATVASLLHQLRCLFPVARPTAEDTGRTDLYRLRAAGEETRGEYATRTEFLHALELRGRFSFVRDGRAARPFQLYNKTNQFNLTGHRASSGEWQQWLDSADCHCVQGSLADRFGDHGIVFVALVKLRDRTLHIENAVLSCRVFNRTLETAFLHWISRMFDDQFSRITGRYVATGRNGPCREFFEHHGFRALSATEGETHFVMESLEFPRTEVIFADER